MLFSPLARASSSSSSQICSDLIRALFDGTQEEEEDTVSQRGQRVSFDQLIGRQLSRITLIGH